MSREVVGVRPACLEDLRAIEALEFGAFGRAGGTIAVRGQAAPTDPRSWVAVGDGAIQGFLSAIIVAGEIEIHDVVVDPAFRRRGVARELVGQVLLEAARAGSGRAVLEVGERNVAARALYEGLGFRPCGRRKGYYRAGSEDALILERPLP